MDAKTAALHNHKNEKAGAPWQVDAVPGMHDRYAGNADGYVPWSLCALDVLGELKNSRYVSPPHLEAQKKESSDLVSAAA